jgi:hypothetical protein
MTTSNLKLVLLPVVLVLAGFFAGLGVASGGDDKVAGAAGIDPQDFTTEVDNPFFPLPVGARWVYEGQGEEGAKRVVIEVQPGTHKVMGVDTVVVRDTVTIDGAMFEDTYDWYAQDRAGDVWYFGESVKYEDGRPVADEGSWTAGVDGARPGILMKAAPAVGERYDQENFDGKPMAAAEVESVNATLDVPYGTFDELLQTKDTTPTEPGIYEHKYYARGLGLMAEIKVGEDETVKLVEASLP